MSDTVRRERGGLEELVLQICNRIENADQGDGIPTDPKKPWTPHRLAAEVAKAFPGAGAAPSTGAISDTLRRWRDYGFAVINEKPLTFDGFTPEAKTVGLAGLKERHRANRPPRQKKTNTAALSGTVTTQVVSQVPAQDDNPGPRGAEKMHDPDDHDGHTVVIEHPDGQKVIYTLTEEDLSNDLSEADREFEAGTTHTFHVHDDDEYAQGDPHPTAQDDVQKGWVPRDEWEGNDGAEEGEPRKESPLSAGRFSEVRRVDLGDDSFTDSVSEGDPFA